MSAARRVRRYHGVGVTGQRAISRRAITLAVFLCIAIAAAWIARQQFVGLDVPRAFPSELRVPILATSALQTLDPIKSAELVQYNLDLQIFECLVVVGPDGAIVPALAHKWESNEDFTVWTFHLREAYFADDPSFPGGKGRRVTSDDVIYSWKRGLNPTLGSLNSWALSSVVVGADAFAAGKSSSVPGLERFDDATIRVRLTKPDRDFPTRLTVLSTAVVPSEAVTKYGEKFGLHPVGTGPFKLEEWIQGEYLLLERNPAYGRGSGWQPPSPQLTRARFIFFRSEAQIANQFQRGNLDVREVAGGDLVSLSDITSLAELKKKFTGANVVRPASIARLHLFAPLIRQGYPFGISAELRRALAAGFTHEQLVMSALGPLGKTSKTLVLPPDVIFDAPPLSQPLPISADEAKERSLLEGHTIKVAFVSSRINDVVVALLKRWLDERGATIKLFPSASINALFASVSEVKPDLTLIYWSPYYPNLANFLTALLTSSIPVPNFTGFSSPELDKLVDQLKFKTGKEAEAVRINIGKILNEQMPWIPLYYDTPIYLAQGRITNFTVNPVSVMLLNDVEIQPSVAGGGSRP